MDHEKFMMANLEQVVGESDFSRRIERILDLYAEYAELQEHQRSERSPDAMLQAVTELLAHLPPDFTFTAIRPALGRNVFGRLLWRAGQPGGPTATGT